MLHIHIAMFSFVLLVKIVIKGDRNSGKSCLFQRLQGRAFQESYIPTDEIQVSSILWSYKGTGVEWIVIKIFTLHCIWDHTYALSLVIVVSYDSFVVSIETQDTVKVEVWDVVDKGKNSLIVTNITTFSCYQMSLTLEDEGTCLMYECGRPL